MTVPADELSLSNLEVHKGEIAFNRGFTQYCIVHQAFHFMAFMAFGAAGAAAFFAFFMAFISNRKGDSMESSSEIVQNTSHTKKLQC